MPTQIEKMFGLKQRPLAQQNDLDMLVSLGYDMQFVQDRFPNCYHMLKDAPPNGLGWSDSDVLNGTYAWFCLQEASLRLQNGTWPVFDTVMGRQSVDIPAGLLHVNREVRCALGVYRGEGSTNDTYNNGGTNIKSVDTNWKSLYGPGQGVTRLTFCPWAYPGEDGSTLGTNLSPITYGQSWSHSWVVADIRFMGRKNNTSFYDPTKREAAIMATSSGEGALIYRNYFENHNDFGVLIDGTPAPCVLMHNSGFYNNVAQVGLRGLSTGNVCVIVQSGDYNPYMFYMFRQGFKGPNGDANFWPSFYNGDPGAVLTVISPKLEAFCCSPRYSGLGGACTPSSSEGKGQMLARLTGRFMFNVFGGTMFAHLGKVNSMTKVDDDFYSANSGNGSTGIPLNGSSIRMFGVHHKRFKHWLHVGNRPVGGNVKYEAYDIVADPSWNDDRAYWDFYWHALSNVGRNPLDPMGGLNHNYPSITGVWDGRQPFINNALNNTWRELTGPLPGDGGYNAFTGNNY